MTCILSREVACGACGGRQTVPDIVSIFGGGAPGLDGRAALCLPLQATVSECARCGYCAYDLAAAPMWAERVVCGAAYREALEAGDLPRLARRFLAVSLLAEVDGDLEAVATARLEAAWACDDEGHAEGARRCRALCVEACEARLASAPGDVDAAIVRVDALRRTGRFGEALDACDALAAVRRSDDPDLERFRGRVLRLQRRLCTARDARGYDTEGRRHLEPGEVPEPEPPRARALAGGRPIPGTDWGYRVSRTPAGFRIEFHADLRPTGALDGATVTPEGLAPARVRSGEARFATAAPRPRVAWLRHARGTFILDLTPPPD